MPLVEERGLKAYRVPAFNRRPEWIEAIATILEDTRQSLLRCLLGRHRKQSVLLRQFGDCDLFMERGGFSFGDIFPCFATEDEVS